METNNHLSWKDFFQVHIYANVTTTYLSVKEQKTIDIRKKIFNFLTFGTLSKLCRWMFSNNPQRNLSEVRKIASAMHEKKLWNLDSPAPIKEAIRAARDQNFHLLINNLCLGSSIAFTETTTLELKTHDATGRPTRTQYHNIHGFDSVVTLCPIAALKGDYDDLPEEKTLAENFKKQGVKWLDIGHDIYDGENMGLPMAYNATFPKSDLIERKEYSTIVNELGEPAIEDMIREKCTYLDEKKASDWFEPVFQELDRAVLGHKKVLVHCQAGISRSATLIAAYLINRCVLTPSQAVTFLQSKRACVDPKDPFIDFLNYYKKKLDSDYEQQFINYNPTVKKGLFQRLFR